jgi:hypothetical protein
MASAQAGRGSARAPDEVRILRDLTAILARDHSVYLRLGPEGAVLTLKLDEKAFAFGKAIEIGWRAMSPGERARAVLDWIRKAAAYSRRPRVRWVPA